MTDSTIHAIDTVDLPRSMGCPVLTVDQLKSVLNYDPATGIFTWRDDMPYKSGPHRNGTVAGSINGSGYRLIGFRFDGGRVSYKASRLAWLYVYGEWPPIDVDHINRIRTDDRIENLRLASPQQNIANRAVSASKKLQVKGVYQEPTWGHGYFAVVVKDRKRLRMGPFDTIEAAQAAYLTEAEKLFGDFACSGTA